MALATVLGPLLLLGFLLGAALPPGGGAPARASTGCPGQAAPPGPPAREELAVAVAPLPVPDPPVGGLAACGDAHAGPVAPPPVGVASYVVADLDTGAVLAARAPHARHRPASTIKLLLALEVTGRLPPDRVVVATAEDANVEGSRAGLGPGGRYTVEQLLQGLLLASGNDCANALARELGGVPATLAAMQDTARRLGALDTRPGSPSGLDAPGTSSSAHDLALVFREALTRPRIATVLTTRSVGFPGFGGRPGFELGNENRLLGTPGFLGGKNGFTDAARHTFVGGAQRSAGGTGTGAGRGPGRRLVVSLVRGEMVPVRMADQARALLDWGFAVPASAAGIGTLPAPGTAGAVPPGPVPPAAPSDGPPPGRAPSGGAPPGNARPGDAPAPDGAGPDGAGPDGAGPGPAAVLAGAAAVAVVAGAVVVVLRARRRRR